MKDGIVLRKLLDKRIRVRHILKGNEEVRIRKVTEIVGETNPGKSKEYEVDYGFRYENIDFTAKQGVFVVKFSEYKAFKEAYDVEVEREKFKDTRYTLGDNAPETDMVNSPDHYKKRYIREVIQSIKGLCTPEEYRGYLKGSKIKYLARYQDKGGIEDLEKGQWFGDELIAFEKEQLELKN